MLTIVWAAWSSASSCFSALDSSWPMGGNGALVMSALATRTLDRDVINVEQMSEE